LISYYTPISCSPRDKSTRNCTLHPQMLFVLFMGCGNINFAPCSFFLHYLILVVLSVYVSVINPYFPDISVFESWEKVIKKRERMKNILVNHMLTKKKDWSWYQYISLGDESLMKVAWAFNHVEKKVKQNPQSLF